VLVERVCRGLILHAGSVFLFHVVQAQMNTSSFLEVGTTAVTNAYAALITITQDTSCHKYSMWMTQALTSSVDPLVVQGDWDVGVRIHG
jgi:hypothetical protein